MRFLGNVLWILLGGLIISLYYFVVGLLFCITIIGIVSICGDVILFFFPLHDKRASEMNSKRQMLM